MLHDEIDIFSKRYQIKASIKIPSDRTSKLGVILAHGSIINRQSLLRTNYSFAEYIAEKLGAYVIAPDFLGETEHFNEVKFNSFSEILNITADYFVEKYDIEVLMGFGHSMGCLVLGQALKENKEIESIVNYGCPFMEFSGKRKSSFIDYMVNYLSKYEYSINIKNLFKHIFDKETCRYFDEVMCKDEEYKSDNYNYIFESNMFRDVMDSSNEYFNTIKKWDKPTLLLFGTNDGATTKTMKHFENGSTNGNIRIEHISNASHVTPCMFSINQLNKLKPVISFYRDIHNIKVPIQSYVELL